MCKLPKVCTVGNIATHNAVPLKMPFCTIFVTFHCRKKALFKKDYVLTKCFQLIIFPFIFGVGIQTDANAQAKCYDQQKGRRSQGKGHPTGTK